VAYTGVMYVSLEAMPLDSAAHVQAAWRLVHCKAVRRVVTPGEIVAAKDRIQFAAVEYGLGLFPEPGVEQECC